MQAKIQRLQEIKDTYTELEEESQQIIKELPEVYCYQNDDGTWTRYKKVDNLKTMEEEGFIYKATKVKAITYEVKTLKNEPKENKK